MVPRQTQLTGSLHQRGQVPASRPWKEDAEPWKVITVSGPPCCDRGSAHQGPQGPPPGLSRPLSAPQAAAPRACGGEAADEAMLPRDDFRVQWAGTSPVRLHPRALLKPAGYKLPLPTHAAADVTGGARAGGRGGAESQGAALLRALVPGSAEAELPRLLGSRPRLSLHGVLAGGLEAGSAKATASQALEQLGLGLGPAPGRRAQPRAAAEDEMPMQLEAPPWARHFAALPLPLGAAAAVAEPWVGAPLPAEDSVGRLGGTAPGRPNRPERTTVMLRNLPNNYTRAMLMDLLDAEGFAHRYDFAYVPADFHTHAGLGFAFVNLVTPADADAVRKHFEGFRRWAIPSNKVCSVGWSAPDQQGLAANIERYRNSSVMHKSVPDEYKPVLLRNGTRIPFPKSTRRLWPPHEAYGVRGRAVPGPAAAKGGEDAGSAGGPAATTSAGRL